MKTIITTGYLYVDIDGLACALAYKELLGLKGIDSEVVFTPELNDTVPESVRNWNLSFSSDIKKGERDLNFVIVDCANPKILPEFVVLKDVVNVFDHHIFGEESLWNKKRTSVVIEEVGSCATLIWEEFVKNNLHTKISNTSANLLYTAIFANTLNFKSFVTTERDRKSFEEISKYTKLPFGWTEKYYNEVEKAVKSSPSNAIEKDTKIVDLESRNTKIAIGQVELWNSKDFVLKNQKIIKKALLSFGVENWFLTAPSISEGINYVYTESESVKRLLSDIFGISFEGNIGKTSKLWLRKEILKKLIV